MFKREFKINFKSLIMWSVILVSIYFLIYAIYPSLINEETKETLKVMMATMPQEMLSAFNMDIVGIETAFGWFRTEGYVFLILLGGMGEKIEWLKNISLFEFASSRYIVLNNHINTTYLWIGLIIIIACVIGTYYRYEYKEFK